MGIFAVTYIYADDSDAERATHRPAHRDFLATLYEKGVLRVSGPVDGGSGALLVLEGGSADEIAVLLDGDPFRAEGLIGDRTIREWSIVFGGLQ